MRKALDLRDQPDTSYQETVAKLFNGDGMLPPQEAAVQRELIAAFRDIMLKKGPHSPDATAFLHQHRQNHYFCLIAETAVGMARTDLSQKTMMQRKATPEEIQHWEEAMRIKNW